MMFVRKQMLLLEVVGARYTFRDPLSTPYLFQFDNLKRVSKKVDELEGSLIDNIQNIFLLPRRLAWYVDMYDYIVNITSAT